jgi:hypothetical protein
MRPDASASAANVVPDDRDQEEEGYPPPWRRIDPPVLHRKATLPSSARTRRRVHPLLFVGVGLLAFVLLWAGVTQALIWGTTVLNGLRYGYPRTFQVDAVVGHQDSAGTPSHFLALNLRGQIEVIEWPGGSAAHARVYLGPQLLGPGGDLEPVTLRFVDLTGKIDLFRSFSPSTGKRVFSLSGKNGVCRSRGKGP